MQLMQSTVSTVDLLQYQSAMPTSSHHVNQHIYSDTTVTSLRIFIPLFHTPPAPISSFFVLVFASFIAQKHYKYSTTKKKHGYLSCRLDNYVHGISRISYPQLSPLCLFFYPLRHSCDKVIQGSLLLFHTASNKKVGGAWKRD